MSKNNLEEAIRTIKATLKNVEKKLGENNEGLCQLATVVHDNNKRVLSTLYKLGAKQIAADPIQAAAAVTGLKPFDVSMDDILSSKKFKKYVRKRVAIEVRKYLKDLEKEAEKEEKKEKKRQMKFAEKESCPLCCKSLEHNGAPVIGVHSIEGKITPLTFDELPKELQEIIVNALGYTDPNADTDEEKKNPEDEKSPEEDVSDDENDEEETEENEENNVEEHHEYLLNDNVTGTDDNGSI